MKTLLIDCSRFTVLNQKNFCLLLLVATLWGCASPKEKTIIIYTNDESPTIQFAIGEIQQSLTEKNFDVEIKSDDDADIVILVEEDNSTLKPEGFSLKKADNQVIITGIDAAGAMYGGLELAEQIKIHGLADVREMSHNPYMEMRGTKFNIPLDARSPSYTDASDVAQKNIGEMWNMEFWREYIDQIARYRYNFISFWSLHPFPSLVKVPDFPDVALDDVHKSTATWDEYYSLGAQGLDATEILDHYSVIKEISIDEKIKFWREVMAYAKSRNVDIYFITWNIFVNGTDGQYGITTDINNEVTVDYFKKSVAAMLRTYPDLAGIGLTTGENMGKASFEQKEDWAFDTYGQGMLEVAQEMPDRQFMFIHRQHQADPQYIAEKFTTLIDQENIEFIYSFKYAKAHVFSATEQPYHQEFVKNIGDLKTIWTLRNDDAYYFRWGSPDFVREFIENIPYEVSRGVYYGSDQWIWGREFTTKNAAEPRQLEVKKHWYHWMLWGRLAYDPAVTNDRFIEILQTQFPEINATQLFQAWHEASMVYPVTTGFHWGRVDFLWYIEGCRSRPKNAGNSTGFHDVNTFINYPVHEKAGNQTIPDYVKMIVNDEKTSLHTPLEISQQLHKHADTAMQLLSSLEDGGNAELQVTLYDIKTISLMGKYYAHKIAGSTYVALYRETKDKSYQTKAVSELTEALDFWKQYVDVAMEQNINPIWTNRVGNVDWVKATEWAQQDIKIAQAD